MTVLAGPLDTLRQLQPMELRGRVAAIKGLTVMVRDLALPIGALVRIKTGAVRNDVGIRGEVVGFDGPHSIVMLLAQTSGIAPGMWVIGEQSTQTIQVGDGLLGRVVDGFCSPIDDGPSLGNTVSRPLHPSAPRVLDRARITDPLPTGVRALDGFLTAGKGQRLGIFSAAGVGKSTLLGSIARNTVADVNVIALIGERGREVREFLDEAIGEEGLRRSVVVVATGDESPVLRVRAAFVACTVAEFFREAGADVMLMMDSITRFAQAQRQIGLASGEQPATRGYTPSVFAMMPILLERAGAIEGSGSITGFYAVLVEGDDLNEPISDSVRGILDGHIVLSRKLATRRHYPAIDIINSISRVADDVCDEHHIAARTHLLKLMAAYSESEELINIGAYARGSNLETDTAIAIRPLLLEFLQQGGGPGAEFPLSCRRMIELSGMAERAADQLATGRESSGSTSQDR